MQKGINVEESVWRELKHRAVDAGCSIGELVGRLVRGTAVVPLEGWKAPAGETAGPRVSNLPARPVHKDNGGSVVPPAPTVPPPHQRTKEDERAKVERMKAALAAMPAKPPLNPKDVYAGKKVRDDDDVEF